MERSVYLLDFLQSYSNQDCGSGGWIDMQINGYNRDTRNRLTQIYTTVFFLTKVQKQFNGGRIDFSTNNARAIGQTIGE